MRVMSYNTLLGGYDGDSDERYRKLAEAINEVQPDVLLGQELHNYLGNRGERVYRLERDTGLRGFLAPATYTNLHTGVFVRPSIKPLSFEADSRHYHHSAAILRAEVPGFELPLTFVSVHLCPIGVEIRAAEVNYLMDLAAPDANALLGGDFNSISPVDPEPKGITKTPPHYFARHAGPDGKVNPRPMQDLYGYGYIDVAERLGENHETTVSTTRFTESDTVPLRLDYFLASPDLAGRLKSYRVAKNPLTGQASDHYPIVVEFE